MRAHRITLALLVTGAVLVAGAAAALAIGIADAGRGTAGGAAGGRGPSAGAGLGASAAGTRVWPLELSAAPDDLTVAEVSFPVPPGMSSLRSLRAAVSGPFGADYLAVASLPRSVTPRGPTALVLLVDRPSPLMDPVDVHLRLRVKRSLAAPVEHRLTDVFAHASRRVSGGSLCDLRLHGRTLAASRLAVLYARGASLGSFTAAGALAQAYDAACGLVYSRAFAQAVQSGAGLTPQPAPAPTPQPGPEPTPQPGPEPTPQPGPEPQPPTPPVGKLPGENCQPRAQYACPL